MNYFTGIDIGSTSIKIVIIDENEQKVNSTSVPTGSHFNQNAINALDKLLLTSDIDPKNNKYIVSTGYGRKLFKTGNENVNEITANAIGVRALGEEYKSIRTIINIGGQDSKVIRLKDDGNVDKFAMNDKCAAGTGRFLEIAARNLEMDIDEFANSHENFNDVNCQVNSTCAVFAESELISLLAAGNNKASIAGGVHESIAKRISRLVNRVGLVDEVLFDGGTAINNGMAKALEDELIVPIRIADEPQITTSLGAAVIAKQQFHK